MPEAFICDPVRTPIGRYGGVLSAVRADDLAAIPIIALLERNERFDPVQVEDLALGCANQAGEDNRNVARMAVLLAGLPVTVPGHGALRCDLAFGGAFYAVVEAASREAQLTLLRAHPDLAGRLAVSGDLTDASAAEQAGAMLTNLKMNQPKIDMNSADEATRLAALQWARRRGSRSGRVARQFAIDRVGRDA